MCFRQSLKDTWTIGISWLHTNHRVDIWFWERSLLFPKHLFILFEFSVCENNSYNVYFLKSFKYNIGTVLSLKLESTKGKAAVNVPSSAHCLVKTYRTLTLCPYVHFICGIQCAGKAGGKMILFLRTSHIESQC